jgi:hypothetical protein
MAALVEGLQARRASRDIEDTKRSFVLVYPEPAGSSLFRTWVDSDSIGYAVNLKYSSEIDINFDTSENTTSSQRERGAGRSRRG